MRFLKRFAFVDDAEVLAGVRVLVRVLTAHATRRGGLHAQAREADVAAAVHAGAGVADGDARAVRFDVAKLTYLADDRGVLVFACHFAVRLVSRVATRGREAFGIAFAQPLDVL